MRRAFALILNYLTALLISCIAGIVIYTAFFSGTTLVAGATVRITKEILVCGFLETAPTVFLLMHLVSMAYKISHKRSPVASILAYLLLTALTWGIFYPGVLFLENKLSPEIQQRKNVQAYRNLSGGYFRQNNGGIYYFIQSEHEETADCIVLDEKNSAGHFGYFDTLDLSPTSAFNYASLPFHDPLIKEAMRSIPYRFINVFTSIKNQAANAWNGGFVSWLWFCSLALALTAVYPFIRVSSWRLVNIFTITLLTALIVLFNAFYFTPDMPIFELLRDTINSMVFNTPVYAYFKTVNQDFSLICINALCSILILLAGITLRAIRGKQD